LKRKGCEVFLIGLCSATRDPCTTRGQD